MATRGKFISCNQAHHHFCNKMTTGNGSPVEWFVKRDDLTGCALTGNKARKLEFWLSHAMNNGHDSIVTWGQGSKNRI